MEVVVKVSFEADRAAAASPRRVGLGAVGAQEAGFVAFFEGIRLRAVFAHEALEAKCCWCAVLNNCEGWYGRHRC
jgi:hypothetical protein